MNQKLLQVYEYAGTGLQRVVESGDWFVGIKNYKPANDVSNLECLERHLLTDEVFVLLEGECVLAVAEPAAELNVKIVKMEKNKVYCVKLGIWHTTILNRECKMILVENRNTGEDNSEILNLSPELIMATQAAVQAQ